MKRGTIVILIILVVALAAAGTSVWYHYRNQHRAQAFWGTTTALLIDKAPTVELVALGEPDRSISLEADDPPAEQPAEKPDESADDAPPAPQAVEFNQTPWIVRQTKDGSDAKGIANLRRALVLDTTFDWASPPAAEEPKWEYGVSVNDGRNWATVLFDFDSRQVGLTGGRRTIVLEAEANDDFRQFFAEQFPDSKADATAKEPDDAPGEPADGSPAEESSDER
jgi:hypothetical protein